MYEYPYGNSQQLNLDWILNKLKEFENSGASSADMKSIANALLSASYDADSAYAINDIVYNDTLETLYICNTVIPVGGEPWDATHWDSFRIGELLTALINASQNLSTDDVANVSNVTGTGLTAALNALVEDVKYNNHYLQQKKNGVYSNVIAIEDTPSNNSDRLASSKAAYDLKGAINNIGTVPITVAKGGTGANNYRDAQINLSVLNAIELTRNKTMTIDVSEYAASMFVYFGKYGSDPIFKMFGSNSGSPVYLSFDSTGSSTDFTCSISNGILSVSVPNYVDGVALQVFPFTRKFTINVS